MSQPPIPKKGAVYHFYGISKQSISRLIADMRRYKSTHRPIVITQNGRAANVFLDVGDYQKLIDKLDLMMDIYKGEQDIAAGRVHSTDDVRRALAAELDSV